MKTRKANPVLNLEQPPKSSYLAEATRSGLPNGVGMLSRVLNEAGVKAAAGAEIAELGNGFIQELEALPQNDLDDLCMFINEHVSPGKSSRPICRINENGKLELADWLTARLPEQSSAPLQKLLDRLCTLAYAGICTPTGELRDDIREYIGEKDIREAAPVFKMKQLIEKFANSAMLYLIVPCLNSLDDENPKQQSIKYIVSTLVNNVNLRTLPDYIQSRNNAAAILKSETIKLNDMRRTLKATIKSFRDEMNALEQELKKSKISASDRNALVTRINERRHAYLAQIAETKQDLRLQMELCEQLLYAAYTAPDTQPLSPGEFEERCRQMQKDIPEVANIDQALQKARRLSASVEAKHIVTPQGAKREILGMFGVDTVRKHSVNTLKTAENKFLLDYYSQKQAVLHLFAVDPDLSAMRTAASANEIAACAGRFLQSEHANDRTAQLFKAMRILSEIQRSQALPEQEKTFLQNLVPLINMLRLMHGSKSYTSLPSYINSGELKQKLLQGAKFVAEAGYKLQNRLPDRENTAYLHDRVQQGIPRLSSQTR